MHSVRRAIFSGVSMAAALSAFALGGAVFDTDKKDIEYDYESYLPQIDLNGPVADIHSRAVEPRMIRAGLKISF